MTNDYRTSTPYSIRGHNVFNQKCSQAQTGEKKEVLCMTTEDIQVTPGIELRILSKILIIFQTEGNLQGKLHQMPYSHLKHVSVYCSWFIIKGIYERNKTSQSQHSVLHWSRQKYVWLSSLPPLMVKRKASQECGNTRFSRMR